MASYIKKNVPLPPFIIIKQFIFWLSSVFQVALINNSNNVDNSNNNNQLEDNMKKGSEKLNKDESSIGAEYKI